MFNAMLGYLNNSPANSRAHSLIKVQVGIDYPAPIVDYKQARHHNLEKIREINAAEEVSVQ